MSYISNREPDFRYLEKVFFRETTDRPVLFDYAVDMKHFEQLTGAALPKGADGLTRLKKVIDGHKMAGYDYAISMASSFAFRSAEQSHALSQSISLNENPLITDTESFERFIWPEPENYNYEKFVKIKDYLPDGMKLISDTPCGVLENLMDLVGYDNLCIMLYEDPELVQLITDNVGQRLYNYCKIVLQMDTVGGIFLGDDWGFNTATFLSPQDLRKYIFPWHKRIVDLAHEYHKYCILHSCGYFGDIIEDVIGIGYDARHSYEDTIIPVEKAYERYGSRIAILGGMDVDFMCREKPETIASRCQKMLERTAGQGGYALGTGNSVPNYIPFENYLALLRTVCLEYNYHWQK